MKTSPAPSVVTKPPQKMLQLSSFHVYLTIFLVVNMAAVLVNHIDDADETYGYWEPLHYLLRGKGLQTWEYAFGLRSYAFLYPLYLFTLQCTALGMSKTQVFYAARVLLGVCTAIAEATFAHTLERVLPAPSVARTTAILLVASPGVFFASTAYLPSAAAMSLVMLSYAAWMDAKTNLAIFWGSAAVLWTGWPFVGVLFAPIGVHLLWQEARQKPNSRLPPSYFLTKLIISGLMIVAIVLAPSLSIDFHFYQKL